MDTKLLHTTSPRAFWVCSTAHKFVLFEHCALWRAVVLVGICLHKTGRFFYLNWICSVLLVVGDKNLYLLKQVPTIDDLLVLRTPIIAAVSVLAGMLMHPRSTQNWAITFLTAFFKGYYSISGLQFATPVLIPASKLDKFKVLIADITLNWFMLIFIAFDQMFWLLYSIILIV